MRTVILGAGGRLGRLMRPIYPAPATWLARSDVDALDEAALAQALAGADAVICLAGVTNASTQPMEMNITLAATALDAARVAGAGPVILFSSAAVYGHTPGILREDGQTDPASPYGEAKLAMEQMASAHPHRNTVLRLGNVAGADAILGNWKPGFALDTLANGATPKRSYIGPCSLARVLDDLAKTPDLPPLMNVAAPGAVEMGALLDAAKLAWQPRPATDSTVGTVMLDTTRLEQFTSFDLRDSTAQGIVADWKTAKDAQ